MAGEVSTLQHETRDDTVEGRALVGQQLALVVREALAKLCKVLGGLGDIVEELEVDSRLLGYLEDAVVSDVS